jgi:hypothetical protein
MTDCPSAGWRVAVVAIALTWTIGAAGVPVAAQAQSSKALRQPPIVVKPLREIEPPRSVPAAKWTAPYCATWDDGCTGCTRTSLRQAPACKPVDHYVGGGTCKPRGVVCTAVLKRHDFTELERLCADWGQVAITRPGVPWQSLRSIYVTSLVYDRKSRRWRSNSQGVLTGRTPEDRRAREEQFARRAMLAISRDPDREFTLTSRDRIHTYFCEIAHKPIGASHAENPDWFELVGEKRP